MLILAELRIAQDFILGYSQPSPRDWFVLATSTQDYVLGYSQPSLRDCCVLTPTRNSRAGLRLWLKAFEKNGRYAGASLGHPSR